jgi:hypothetical protein
VTDSDKPFLVCKLDRLNVRLAFGERIASQNMDSDRGCFS